MPKWNGMEGCNRFTGPPPLLCMHQKPFSHPVLGLCKNGDGSGSASQEVDLCPFGSGEMMMREEKHFWKRTLSFGEIHTQGTPSFIHVYFVTCQ